MRGNRGILVQRRPVKGPLTLLSNLFGDKQKIRCDPFMADISRFGSNRIELKIRERKFRVKWAHYVAAQGNIGNGGGLLVTVGTNRKDSLRRLFCQSNDCHSVYTSSETSSVGLLSLGLYRRPTARCVNGGVTQSASCIEAWRYRPLLPMIMSVPYHQ